MVTELLSLIGPAGQMVRVLLSSDWLSELFTGASFPLTLRPQPAPLIHFSATTLSDAATLVTTVLSVSELVDFFIAMHFE